MLRFNKVNILVIINSLMNSLVEIKTAIARDETSALLSWLQERSEDDWDKQIKQDSEQGKLNKIIQRAKANIAANRVKKLDKVINNS
jgi:phage shock protein A